MWNNLYSVRSPKWLLSAGGVLIHFLILITLVYPTRGSREGSGGIGRGGSRGPLFISNAAGINFGGENLSLNSLIQNPILEEKMKKHCCPFRDKWQFLCWLVIYCSEFAVCLTKTGSMMEIAVERGRITTVIFSNLIICLPVFLSH